MDAELAVRNLFGRAERIAFHMETGQNKSNSAMITASRSRWFGAGTELRAELRKQLISHQKHSSYSEKLRAGSVTAQFGNASSASGMHELSYEVAMREICQVPPRTASWSIIQQRGFSLKNALRHVYARSTLDDSIVPASGTRLRLLNEISVGAASLFRKHVLEAALYFPLAPMSFPGLSCGIVVASGIIRPLASLGPQSQVTNAEAPPAGVSISDRLFLGGVGGSTPFPGFRTFGVGPHEVRHTHDGQIHPRTPRDALGGDTLAIATANVSYPLGGHFSRYGIHGQAFASVGTLNSLSTYNSKASSTLQAFLHSLFASARASVGAGLIIPTALGRLEISLSHVIRRQSQDIVQRNGLQIGVSST